MPVEFNSQYFMREAMKEARRAFDEDEIPVGAVIVCDNKIIGRGHNQTERLNDVTAHAEMIAITAAANHLGSKYLPECDLYVTLEPCVMCAGALQWAQIRKIVYAASDIKRGYGLIERNILHPKTVVERGVMQEESEVLLKAFFQKLRGA
jgi:tRNA(adenine34) deaminase